MTDHLYYNITCLKKQELCSLYLVCKSPTKKSTAQSTHTLCKVKGYPEILSPKFGELNFCINTRPKKLEQETSVNLASMICVNAIYLQDVQYTFFATTSES